jgi:DNA-binding transcriptional ArsR family regulator
MEDKFLNYNESQIAISEYSKALAHPARIKILKILSKYDSCICNDIVKELPLAQSTVSQHLKELKKSGLIDSQADGTRSIYFLNKKALKSYRKEMDKFFKKFK